MCVPLPYCCVSYLCAAVKVLCLGSSVWGSGQCNHLENWMCLHLCIIGFFFQATKEKCEAKCALSATSALDNKSYTLDL